MPSTCASSTLSLVEKLDEMENTEGESSLNGYKVDNEAKYKPYRDTFICNKMGMEEVMLSVVDLINTGKYHEY